MMTTTNAAAASDALAAFQALTGEADRLYALAETYAVQGDAEAERVAAREADAAHDRAVQLALKAGLV